MNVVKCKYIYIYIYIDNYLNRVEVISSAPFSTFWSSGPWNILSANKNPKIKERECTKKIANDFRILATCDNFTE